MTKITIVGAGIMGMTIASQLPKSYEITIIARNLPGDPESLEWASPWAGAVWMGQADSTPQEQKMQFQAFAWWWKLAMSHPESSVRQIEMHDLIDTMPLEKIWYRNLMPDFRIMTKDELPEGTKLGMCYKSVVISPMTFLPWMRKQLEKDGVKFQRTTIRSLSDLKGLGHDVLINATGIGSYFLTDVVDKKVQRVRGQTILVKSNYDKIWIRRGVEDYTYALSRLDGTCILGGVKEFGNLNTEVEEARRDDIFRRITLNLPEAFPKGKFEVIRDIVGIRPQREGGARVEKEILNGEKVVHAYGPNGGAWIFSMGIARAVVDMVTDFELPIPVAKL